MDGDRLTSASRRIHDSDRGEKVELHGKSQVTLLNNPNDLQKGTKKNENGPVLVFALCGAHRRCHGVQCAVAPKEATIRSI